MPSWRDSSITNKFLEDWKQLTWFKSFFSANAIELFLGYWDGWGKGNKQKRWEPNKNKKELGNIWTYKPAAGFFNHNCSAENQSIISGNRYFYTCESQINWTLNPRTGLFETRTPSWLVLMCHYNPQSTWLQILVEENKKGLHQCDCHHFAQLDSWPSYLSPSQPLGNISWSI